MIRNKKHENDCSFDSFFESLHKELEVKSHYRKV